MLDGGAWKVEGNQLIISIAASATLIEMSVSADARRLMIAAASGVLGRAIKLQIVPGLSPAATPQKSTSAYANGTGRSRAEEEPVVRRMKEKFGAEIRTVIDYRKEK
jgi:DNA polymerase-3 subunit gamma/tau